MLMKPKIAYVTRQMNLENSYSQIDKDIPYVQQAAQKLQIDLQICHWQDKSINWSNYAAVVIRSTWNYTTMRDKFLQWIKHVDSQTKLFNPAKIIQLNTQKSYLKQLESKGLPIVPTKYATNKQEAEEKIEQALKQNKRIIIKPSIGASSINVGIAQNKKSAINFANYILNNKYGKVLIQPYIQDVEYQGEKSIVVLDGKISHVLRKTTSLSIDHGEGCISLQITTQIEQFIQKIKNIYGSVWNQLAYTRVDVIRYKKQLVLMQLELTQPYLFIKLRPDAAKQLLNSIVKRIK